MPWPFSLIAPENTIWLPPATLRPELVTSTERPEPGLASVPLVEIDAAIVTSAEVASMSTPREVTPLIEPPSTSMPVEDAPCPTFASVMPLAAPLDETELNCTPVALAN